MSRVDETMSMRREEKLLAQSFMRFVSIGVALALWCCRSGVARAEAASPMQCHGVTTRPDEAILVPVDDEPPAEGRRVDTIIELGETLCLAGTVDAEGEVMDLHLADEASGEPTLLKFAFRKAETTTVLEVQSSSSRWIRYRAAFLHGRARIAIPTGVLDIPPTGHGFEMWPAGESRLMLFGFRTVEHEAVPEPPPAPALASPERRVVSIALRLGGGARSISVGRIDRLLEERGYSGVSGVSPTLFGIGGGGNLGRIRFDFVVNVSGKKSRSSRDEADVWTSIGDIIFAAGYDVFRTGGFSLFGLAGAGVSTIQTDAHVLRVGEKDDRVKQESGVVTLDLGAEQIIPLGRASGAEGWNLVFDLRGGVVAQFVDGSWRLDDKRGTEVLGPSVNLLGARVLLSVGFGVYGW